MQELEELDYNKSLIIERYLPLARNYLKVFFQHGLARHIQPQFYSIEERDLHMATYNVYIRGKKHEDASIVCSFPHSYYGQEF